MAGTRRQKASRRARARSTTPPPQQRPLQVPGQRARRGVQRSGARGASPRLLTGRLAAPVAYAARTSQSRDDRATPTAEPGACTGRARNKRATTAAGTQQVGGRRGAARTAERAVKGNTGGAGGGGEGEAEVPQPNVNGPLRRIGWYPRQRGCQSLCRTAGARRAAAVRGTAGRPANAGRCQEGCAPPLQTTAAKSHEANSSS